MASSNDGWFFALITPRIEDGNPSTYVVSVISFIYSWTALASGGDLLLVLTLHSSCKRNSTLEEYS